MLSCIVNNFRDGQEAALKDSLVSICLEQLNDPYPPLRQWVAICLGHLWNHYEKARWTGVRDTAHEKLYSLLKDPCAEVGFEKNFIFLISDQFPGSIYYNDSNITICKYAINETFNSFLFNTKNT